MTEPWAVPGSSTDQPAPDRSLPPGPAQRDPSGPRRGQDTSGSATPLPPFPVPLRPMTVADLLDGAFAILKSRPRDVLILATTFIVPLQIVVSVLIRDSLSSDSIGSIVFGGSDGMTFDDSGDTVGFAPSIASLAVSTCSLALVAGAIALLVADWMAGRHRTPQELIVATLRRSPALLAGVVVVHLIEGISLVAAIVGAYFAMCFLHVVSPVIAAEGAGPFRAVARSVRLTRAFVGRTISLPSLVALVGTLVVFGFQLVADVAVTPVPEEWRWVVRSAGSTLAQLVATPFTAGVAVLYHLDLRMRAEGMDIRRALAERS